MSESQWNEIRKQPRTPVKLQVKYEQMNAFFAEYTRNISKGGMFIETTSPLPIGDDFIFELIVPNISEPLQLHGKVQWADGSPDPQSGQKPGMGVEFVYSSQEEREKIEKIVVDLMVEQLGPEVSSILLSSKKNK